MKLWEYIAQLKIYAAKAPNAQVIYAVDDEGSEYKDVAYGPITGYLQEKHNLQTFQPDDSSTEYILIN